MTTVTMPTPTKLMAKPGPIYQQFEQEIIKNSEKVSAHTRDRRCKVIQAVALSALFIIAAVAAFVLASLYAPNYAPIVLFVGAYLLIDKMGHCVKTNFKDKWTVLDKEIEKLQALAKKHLAITNDTEYQTKLKSEFPSATDDELKKYTNLAAHYEYWKDVADNAIKAHRETLAESAEIQSNPEIKKSQKLAKKALKLAIRSQQLREEALEARVSSAFARAIMKRPNCTAQKPLYITHYAPIPLQETDDDMRVNVSFESSWAQNLLNRDLPPYENRFFETTRERDRSFLRAEVLKPEEFENIVQEIVETIDAQATV